MAKAQKIEIVTKEYDLKLSQEEAEVLAAILLKIGGSPEKSPRKHTQSISEALAEVGVSGWSDSLTEDKFPTSPSQNGIYFKNYPEKDGGKIVR